MADIQLDAKTFRRFRKRHKFATPELAEQAALVERDLELLPQLGPNNPDMRATIKQRLAVFADAMAAAVAAISLGRKFIGIERKPQFFDAACRRIAEEVGRPRLPFDDPPVAPTQEALL